MIYCFILPKKFKKKLLRLEKVIKLILKSNFLYTIIDLDSYFVSEIVIDMIRNSFLCMHT